MIENSNKTDEQRKYRENRKFFCKHNFLLNPVRNAR